MQDLVVISLPGKNYAATWPSKQEWFHAENCACQLLVGTAALLPGVPESILERAARTPAIPINPQERMDAERRTMIFRGRDAYHFLLRFATGLESKKASEHFVWQDLRKKWKKYQEKYSAAPNARALLKPMDHIFSDTRKIRHYIYGQSLPSLSYQRSAVELAQIKKGDQALLIADRGDITKHTARVVGRDVEEGVKKLTVTHPVDFSLLDRMDELTRLREQKFIGASLIFEFFPEAMNSATNTDHVIVCTPMLDTLLSTHRHIADIWQQRKRESGKLILVGDRKRSSNMHQFWSEAALENCILPNDIRAKYTADVMQRQHTLQRASDACYRAALVREVGLSSGVVEKIIANQSDEPIDNFRAHLDDMIAGKQEAKRVAMQREQEALDRKALRRAALQAALV